MNSIFTLRRPWILSLCVLIFLNACTHVPKASLSLPQVSKQMDKDTEIPMKRGEGCVSYAVTFSPDGQFLASGGDWSVCLWEINSGQLIREFQLPDQFPANGHGDFLAVAFSPNGNYIIGGRRDRTIRLWDVRTGELLRTFVGHEFGLRTVTFSPDGQFIASGSHDGTVRLWETESGKQVRMFQGYTDGIHFSESVHFSPDGKLIVAGGTDGTVRLWETKTGKEFGEIRVADDVIRFAGFSPDGRKIHIFVSDGSIETWEIATNRQVQLTTKRSDRWGYTADLSPDGKFMILGTFDGAAVLENAENGDEVKVFQEGKHVLRGIAFGPTGRTFASIAYDGNIWLWNIHESKPFKTIDVTNRSEN